MSPPLMLALLFFAVAAIACAMSLSCATPAHPRRWDAALALVLGFAALELVVLGSSLGVLLPLLALLGLPLPLLVGPFWRRRRSRTAWALSRWFGECLPALTMTLTAIAIQAIDAAPPMAPAGLPAWLLLLIAVADAGARAAARAMRRFAALAAAATHRLR